MTVRGVSDDKWHVKFLHAYYFITVTMVTVGFGDISPVNNEEVLLCIVTMLIACGVFVILKNFFYFIIFIDVLYILKAFVMNEIGLIL